MGVWMWVQVYLLYLLAVAVHEVGHALAAGLVGSPWVVIAVGPLKLSREQGPIRVGLSKNPFGGFVKPSHNPRGTRTRFALILAAWPAASLLLAVAAAFALLRLPPPQQDADWQVTTLLVIPAFMFILSVIPISSHGQKNDAALMVGLWKQSGEWKDYYAQLDEYNARQAAWRVAQDRYQALTDLAEWSAEGRRRRDWDGATVERAVSLRDGDINEATATHYAFYWAEDRDDVEASGRFIGRALELRESMPETDRHWYVLNCAYYAGRG